MAMDSGGIYSLVMSEICSSVSSESATLVYQLRTLSDGCQLDFEVDPVGFLYY